MHSRRDLWTALAVLRGRVFDRMQGGLASLGLDLSLSQSVALTQIAEKGPLTISGLQACIARSQATTSHLVTQLELAGLVERASDPEDARRTLVRLSKEGRKRFRRLEKLRRESFEEVMGGVSAPVRRQLEEALWTFIDALEEKS